MEKPLQIPPGKKIKHLTVYCRHKECKTNVSDICKCSGKDIIKCPHPEKHVFKSYVPVSGSSNERRTKQYDSRDINEVIPQAIEFEKSVKENQLDIKIDAPTSKRKREKVETENIPTSIAHVLARFIAYQANESTKPSTKRTFTRTYQGHGNFSKVIR